MEQLLQRILYPGWLKGNTQANKKNCLSRGKTELASYDCVLGNIRNLTQVWGLASPANCTQFIAKPSLSFCCCCCSISLFLFACFHCRIGALANCPPSQKKQDGLPSLSDLVKPKDFFRVLAFCLQRWANNALIEEMRTQNMNQHWHSTQHMKYILQKRNHSESQTQNPSCFTLSDPHHFNLTKFSACIETLFQKYFWHIFWHSFWHIY